MDFIKCILIVLGIVTIVLPAEARARAEWWCEKHDTSPCTEAELSNPLVYRQVLVLPAGFKANEDWLFRSEVSRMIRSMTQINERVYTSKYREQLLYVSHWLPGGALGTPESNFGAFIAPHPIRGTALTLQLDEVVKSVTELQIGDRRISPFGVVVLFNSAEEEHTANASPPSFLGLSYGIAKITRGDLNGNYIAMHELAHAALNFGDEYIEAGFEKMSINTLDYLTPLAVFKKGFGGWKHLIANALGVFDYRVSEILAANGMDNIDTTRHPSRVHTPGYRPNEYEHEGGMFFGAGTFHDRGKNVMNGGEKTAPDDGFDWDHSGSQQAVLRHVFEHPQDAPRPNDRIRNAGPLTNWPSAWGRSTHVMVFDADKNHQFHPTQSYELQVGWYERDWKTCWKGFLPYPCYEDKWVTAQKTIHSEKRTLALKSSRLYGAVGLLQKVACHFGLDNIKSGDGNFQLCLAPVDKLATMFLPTMEFPLPYQDIAVPTSQWFTRYYWRFRTDNGAMKSGFTGWSSFYRYL